jgi:hypothetical protein
MALTSKTYVSWILNVCFHLLPLARPPLNFADFQSLWLAAVWFSLSSTMDPIHNSGQLMAVWDQKLLIFGGALRSLGNIKDPAFYYTLNTRGLFDPAINQAYIPAIKIFFALHNLDFLLQDKYLVDNTMSVDLLSYNPQPLLSFAVQICHGGVIV